MTFTWGARALIVIGWLAVVVGVAGVGLRWLDVHDQRLIVLGSAAPYLMATAVVGVLILGLTRHWIGFGVALCVAAAATLTQAPLYVPDRHDVTGPTVTAMQANIWLGNADTDSLVAQVKSMEVDVIAVNELTNSALERLIASGIESELPYSFVRPLPTGGGGTGLWSRFPLTDQVHHEEFILNALSARIQLPDGKSAAVYALHPVPPWPVETWVWAGEMDRIRTMLEAIPEDSGPVIIIGDFNSTRDHVKFRDLVTGRFRDAADQVGGGIQNTYPADRQPLPPMIAIDHILTSGAQAQSVETVVLAGSDHRGLLAKLTLQF